MSHDSLAKGLDARIVPNGAGGFGCGGVAPLTLFTLFDPGLDIMFISRPVKPSLHMSKSFLCSEMAKVVMYCLEYCVTDAGGNNHLGVCQLSGRFTISTTNKGILYEALPKTWGVPTRNCTMLNVLLKSSRLRFIKLCSHKFIRIHQQHFCIYCGYKWAIRGWRDSG